MSYESSTSSADSPVIVRKSDYRRKSQESIRLEEKFEMRDREYKILEPPTTKEWGGTVSKILLFPSAEPWHVLVTFSVIFAYVLALYCMFFVPEQLLTCLPYYAICDFVYFFDLALNLLHRFWKKLQRKFQLKLTRTKLLVVDTLSLLPQEAIFGAIYGFDHWTARYCRVLTFIRLYRVVNLFDDILGSVRSKRWRWFLAQYVVLFSIVLHTAVCIWYRLGAVTTSLETLNIYWTATLSESNLSVRSIYDWYITCLYVAISFISNTGFGDFYATSLSEGVYCICVMLIGFMLVAVLIAVLTVQLINVGTRKAEFSYQLDNIKNVLKQINVSPELNKQIIDYYFVLWTKNDGVDKAPELYTLPASLRMELMYDVNIAHLQNSLLFKNQPEPLLRKLSLLINHIVLLPGDVFYHQGVVKGKMVFIASGVLEILSDEDDQSPIISFRAGTVLGEVSLLMTVPAKATVRAATYAELQVIERQDFMRMMVDHPDTTAELRETINIRLQQADAELRMHDKDQVRMNLLVSSNVKEFRPIKLLKNHLSNIKEDCDDQEFKALAAFADEENAEFSFTIQKPNFNTACLSLYKLVQNVTMIENPRICTSSRFPWILHPRSSLVRRWQNVVNVSQVLLCIILPYHIVYMRDLNPFFSLYGYLADGIYFLDIYVRCSTAVVLRNRTIRNFKAILYHRMKYLSFYVDVFSLFPIELLAFALHMARDQQKRFFVLLKLNRMLRIWRVRRIFANFETDICRNVLVLALTKFAVYLVLSAYWSGAILFLESCLYPVCTKGNWFYVEMINAIKLGILEPCYEHPVAISTYFGTMVLFLVGYGDIIPNSSMDILFVCLLVLLGIFLVCYSTAQLCATFSLHDRFRREFQDNVIALGRFLEEHNLMYSLHKRVITFFRLQWYYDKGTGRDFLLRSVPPSLRSAIQSTELKTALSKTPLFEMVDVDFLIMIAEGAKIQVLPEDEVIAYTGDMSREMHIILSGHCQILSDSGDVLESYGPGAQFGALEMVYGIPKRYTTRTVTNCKVITVDYRTYVQAMSMFPTMMQETKLVMEQEELVKWVRRIDDERLHPKVVKKEAVKKNITQWCIFVFLDCISRFVSSSFIFTRAQCKKSKGKEKYWEPFAKMRKWQVVGYFLMPLVIHPGGPFLRIWCFIRGIAIMIVCFLGPYYIAVVPYSASLYSIMVVTDLCAYIDMYLLLHVAYYNEKGILVTHPKYTAKHYVTHSFIIDLLAVFPFSLLVSWENPKHDEGHDRITHLVTPHVLHCAWHFNVLLQLHRIQELFQYLEADILQTMEVIRFFKYIPTAMVIINLIASLIFGMTCNYKFYTSRQDDPMSEIVVVDPSADTTYYGYLKCSNGSWMEQSQFSHFTNPMAVYLVAIYWVTGTLFGVGTGDVVANTRGTMYIVICTILLGRLLFAYVFAHLAYGRTQFSSVLSEYQENLKDLMRYFKSEAVDIQWQEKLFEYFEYVWIRTSGVQPQELCQKLNTALMEDTVVFLYEKTLREVPLFENVEKSFIRVIAKHLTQQYFLKGDTVIRCFDVQRNIYIIYRGKVEVLSSYNEMIACMGPGGLFGNIRQVNDGCRSVSIIASRNLDVLVIPSDTFYNVIKDYPRIRHNMDKLLETITDYIMPTSIIDNESYEYSLDVSDATEASAPSKNSSTADSSSQVTPRRSFGSFSATSRIQEGHRKQKILSLKTALNIFLPHKWFKFVIFPDNIMLKITDVAVLLVSFYDVLVISYCFVTQTHSMPLFYCSFVLESIIYLKLLLHFHVAFMDRYGNYVVRFKKIAHHYFANHYKVFWDVVPNLPVEPFCLAFPPEHRTFALTILRLIHLLRLRYMLDYFKQVNKQLMTNLALTQIIKIILFLCITIHIFSCAWIMIACPFGHCLEDSWVINFNFTSDRPVHRYAVAAYYIVSLTTTTGIGDIFPNTVMEVLLSITIIFISRFLTALVIGDMVTVINVSSRSLVNYEYRIYCLQDFLRNQNLSDHQMEKLWRYMRNLWTHEKGQHVPKMLQSCPYVLKCDIMNVMYGQHLRNSFLFQNLHEALLRQLAVRLQRIVFFRGNYIVQHGDIDQNMYFIHSGEVSVLTVHPNLTETQHELLKPHEMFGLAQGLYHGVPHHFSFRANTKVSILVLNLDLWHYMLRYFPEDKEIIYNRAQSVYVKL